MQGLFLFNIKGGSFLPVVNFVRADDRRNPSFRPVSVTQSTVSPSKADKSPHRSGVPAWIKRLLCVSGEKSDRADERGTGRQIGMPLTPVSTLSRAWDPVKGAAELLKQMKDDPSLKEYCEKGGMQGKEKLVVTYLMHQGQRAFERFFTMNEIRPNNISDKEWKTVSAAVKQSLGKQAWTALQTRLADHPLAACLKEESLKNFMELASHSLNTCAGTLSGKLHRRLPQGAWPGDGDPDALRQLISSACNAYCAEIWHELKPDLKPDPYPDIYGYVTAYLQQQRQDEQSCDIRL